MRNTCILLEISGIQLCPGCWAHVYSSVCVYLLFSSGQELCTWLRLYCIVVLYHGMILNVIYNSVGGWGLGAFLKWWPPSTIWADPLIFHGHHWGCLNNPIFQNLGLCAACWAHFMCHHELWPTSVSHPFSSLNSYLGLTGGKYYQKITIPIFRLVLQHFALPGCFPYILFYRYIFSLLPSG